jgi:pimeloyl-ACP methyl ester carboxylesterase
MFSVKFPTAQSASMGSIFSIEKPGRRMDLRFCSCTGCRHLPGCISRCWSRTWSASTIWSSRTIPALDIRPGRITKAYTFDHLAKVIQDLTEQLHLDRYTLFMQDYGGPVGFRMALAHPEKVQAMIIQNAVSHEEGLSSLWAVRRSFWQDRPAHETEVRNNLLSLEATRKRHVGTSPDPAQYDPDLWVDEYYFLNQPGQGDIQLDLFYDYQNNLKSYPKWQQWLRDNKPPLLVLWGRYDTSFTVAGGEAYKKDDPRAEVHILDAGHFALDLKPKEIIRLTQDFMARQGRK